MTANQSMFFGNAVCRWTGKLGALTSITKLQHNSQTDDDNDQQFCIHDEDTNPM